jgi:hypothetical protein
MKSAARTQLVMRICLATLATVLVLGVAIGARWSTIALLLLMSVTPMVVALLLGFSRGASTTPHELLYAVNNPRREGRS